MKQLQKILITSCLLLISIISYGQCDTILLRNQEEINNFIKNYGKCTTVKQLTINDLNDDITQFDSLYSIVRITGRFNLFLTKSNVNQKNLDGFKNLKYVDFLNASLYNVTGNFSNLDSVKSLSISNYIPQNIEYFEYIPNLKHIDRALYVFSNLTELKTHHFTTGNNFELNIDKIGDSTTLKVLSSRIKTENLKVLSIFTSSNMDLRFLTILDSLEDLSIAYCKNNDFSVISKLKNIKTFHWTNDLGSNNFGNGLFNITHLDYLSIQNIKSYIDFKNILPNLTHIDRYMALVGCDSLFNLDFLDNVSPPQEINLNSISTIILGYNKRLNNCNSPFLCKALSRYPESVWIHDNHWKCSKEEILKYCSTVSTTDHQLSTLSVYPNPTYGIVNIQGLTSPAEVKIININGQVVKAERSTTHKIDLSDLPNSLYIFEISTDQHKEYHKVIKLE